MKILLWIPLACIKPNAERNVKPAPQNCAAWVLPFWNIKARETSAFRPGSIVSLILTATLWTSALTYGADSSIPTPAATPLLTANIPLTPITANKFTVQILKHSVSNKIYLLQLADQTMPKPGKILLLRNQAESIMAFRVLKSTLADQTLIGQVIKRYGNHTELQTGEQYDAIEKIGDLEDTSDIIEAPEAEFEDPNWETDETSKNILAYDPELDEGSTLAETQTAMLDTSLPMGKNAPLSAAPFSALELKVSLLESKIAELETKTAANELEIKRAPSEVKNSSPGDSKENGSASNQEKQPLPEKLPEKLQEKLDDDLLDKDDTPTPDTSQSVDETKLFDNYAHWLSIGFGYVTNNAADGSGSIPLSAGNLKYGVTLRRRLILDKPQLQDSLVLDGGVYFYKAINFAAQGDSYTVLSLGANFRYNLFFSESLGIFAYAGALQSNVIATVSPVASGTAALNSILPSLGGGILLQIGPSWYARLTVGMDDISLNLLLRF